MESSDTTRYKWSFAKNLNKMEMDTIRDNVDSMTSQSRGDDRLSGKRRAQAVGPTMPDTVGAFFFVFVFLFRGIFLQGCDINAVYRQGRSTRKR